METNCGYCGKALVQFAGCKPKKFCDDACRLAWWAQHRDQLKRTAVTCYTCQNCGKKFVDYTSLCRIYCSQACAAQGKRNFVQEMFAEAKIRYLGGENEARGGANAFKNVQMVLPGDEIDAKRAFLIGGVCKFHGKIDQFAGHIPNMMQGNILRGDVFAFCNERRYLLAILQWQGDGFLLFYKRAEYARYPWPTQKSHEVIEVLPEDLRKVIDYPRLLQRLEGNVAASGILF